MVDLPGIFRPEDWLRFVHLKPFERKWSSIGMDDDDLRALEAIIMANPTLGPVQRGTGGLRKMRFAKENSGRGKSGAIRVCYSYFPGYATVVLVTAYAKNEQVNLTDADKAAIARILQAIQEEFDRGIP
ncbi:MAG: hypothetical protein U0800_16560 [Isosphaeraceae bacterium]